MGPWSDRVGVLGRRAGGPRAPSLPAGEDASQKVDVSRAGECPPQDLNSPVP